MSWNWTLNRDRIGDGISTVAGGALVALPHIVPMNETAFWSAQVGGGLIAVLGLVAIWRAHDGMDWARIVLGSWVALSPLVLASGFTVNLATAHILLGLAALAYPAWRRWLNEGGNWHFSA